MTQQHERETSRHDHVQEKYAKQTEFFGDHHIFSLSWTREIVHDTYGDEWDDETAEEGNNEQSNDMKSPRRCLLMLLVIFHTWCAWLFSICDMMRWDDGIRYLVRSPHVIFPSSFLSSIDLSSVFFSSGIFLPVLHVFLVRSLVVSLIIFSLSSHLSSRLLSWWPGDSSLPVLTILFYAHIAW